MGRVQGLMIAVIVALLALPAAAHAVVLQRGDILVADANAFGNPGGVILVNPTTGAQTTVSSGGSFNFPIGIAVAANRDIYVSDAQAFGGGGGVIRVNPATGAQTTVSSGGSFVDPGGIAIDNDGSILVADANAFGGGGGIIRVNPTTGAQTTVSSGGLFQQPSDLALEANGSIVVAENNNEQVIRVNPTTGAQTLVASSTGNLEGIAVEANGNILVTRPGFSVPDRVIRVNALTGAQSILSEANTFNQPNGLDVEADGNIVVADQDAFGGSGGVIRVNPTTGAQSTVASGGSFVDPFGIAVVRPAAPVAATDAYATDEDTALNVTAPGVLGNDSDLDGDPLTAALATGPAHGTVTFNANGSFRYTPAANYNGTDTFTYRASDGSLTSPPTQVTITVRAVNDAPAATADTYATDEDTTLDVPAGTGVLANDSDLDGDALSAVLATGPAHGTLTLNANGSLRYVPAANYNGPDSFTYRASDGSLVSPAVTVSLTVRAVNDAPAATADTYATDEDTTLDVPAGTGVLANDTDVDSANLSAALVSGPAHGTLTLNGNGSFRYVPAANYNGPDSFTYRASDGALSSAVTTASITVRSVNDAPGATADALTTDEDVTLDLPAPGVLGNDTDVDGDALSAVLATGPAHGTLTLNANGSLRYVPAANYNGPDSFTYRASDGALSSPVTTASITVRPVNDAPSAADHAYTTAEDTPLTVNVPGVLAGAADADGDALSAALVSGPGHGEVTLNRNGSFTYTPARDFNGADSFRYRAGDGTLDSTPATVSITVTAVNDAPGATADAYATDEDRPLAVDAPGVLANDTDLDGDALSAVLVSGPAHGDLTLKPDGSFSYIPARDYNGADAFTYRASDGTLESAPVTVALDVHPVDEVALPAAPPPAPVTGAGEATLSVQSAGLSVFVRSRSSMRCRVSTGRLRSCTVRLQAGKRVIATGSHRASGAGVVVRLRLTRSGKAMLARRLGGVRAQVRVSAVTDRGARQATASTRAVLQVEHFTTPAGSWNPAEATLTAKGTRFVKHLRGKLIAVAKLRCDGYDANVRPGPGSSAEMSLARAKTLCAALGLHVRPRLVGHADADPIASNATEPGRAANRRVEVTVTHAPRRLPR